MNTTYQPFQANGGTELHEGTFEQLKVWLEKYLKLFGALGQHIDFWDVLKSPENRTLKQLRTIHHCTAYVVRGRSEGFTLYVAISFSDFGMVPVARLKYRGTADEAYLVARVLQEVMDSIFFYHLQPHAVDIAAKVPRKGTFPYEVTTSGQVIISREEDIVKVVNDGKVLDLQVFRPDGGNFQAKAYASDWQRVLADNGVKSTIRLAKIIVDPRVPGYDISYSECRHPGVYVIIPGGSNLRDADYVGWYSTEEEAIAGAIEHQMKAAAKAREVANV